MSRACCSPLSGARFPGACKAFPHLPRVRGLRARSAGALGCTVVYGFGVVPTDLGTAPPYDRSAENMGNSVPFYPKAKGSHSEGVYSALAAPNGGSPGPQGVWPTSAASRPRNAQGDARTTVLVRQIQRLEGHPGSDYHGASTLAACCRRPRCTTPAVRKRLSPDLPLLRLPRCSAKPSVWSRNADHIPASRLLLNTDFHLRTPSCRPCSGAFGNRVPLKTLYGRVETSCP